MSVVYLSMPSPKCFINEGLNQVFQIVKVGSKMNPTSLVAVFCSTSLEFRLDQLLRLLVLCFDGSHQVGFEVKTHRGNGERRRTISCIVAPAGSSLAW